MKKEFKLLYGVFAIMILSITTIGATYAYWTASTSSLNNAVNTSSTIYSISMDITPLYHDFSIIPMDDMDALKALKNQCKDTKEMQLIKKLHLFLCFFPQLLQK